MDSLGFFVLAGATLMLRLFKPRRKKHIVAHITFIKPAISNDDIMPFSQSYQLLYESLLQHAEEEASKLE